MSTSYPGAVDGFTTKSDNVDDVVASHVNNLQDGLVAAQRQINAIQKSYVISVTVVSNDLTLALKNLSGSNPATTEPVVVKVGDTIRQITAALSVTAVSGQNWFNAGNSELATRDVDYFVYLIGETGASAGVKIGFARIPYARLMSDFVNTSTSERYIKGNWTTFNASDPVTLIGRFNAILGVGAAHNWSLTTQVIVNYPIYFTRQLTYTPAITSGSGTITTVGAVTGSYQVVNTRLYVQHSITITTAGTAGGSASVTIPFAGIVDSVHGAGRESGVSGAMCQGRPSGASVLLWLKYDNTTIFANGAVLLGTISGVRIV